MTVPSRSSDVFPKVPLAARERAAVQKRHRPSEPFPEKTSGDKNGIIGAGEADKAILPYHAAPTSHCNEAEERNG